MATRRTCENSLASRVARVGGSTGNVAVSSRGFYRRVSDRNDLRRYCGNHPSDLIETQILAAFSLRHFVNDGIQRDVARDARHVSNFSWRTAPLWSHTKG